MKKYFVRVINDSITKPIDWRDEFTSDESNFPFLQSFSGDNCI